MLLSALLGSSVSGIFSVNRRIASSDQFFRGSRMR
uniref:Uncharacterized protein n=1 Tax=Arundo donax TaxID=35708 RepID=A0A0A8YI51_ARUDO